MKRITISNVNEGNKLAFMRQEARYLGHVLNVPPVNVSFSKAVDRVEVTGTEVDCKLVFNPEEKVHDMITFLADVTRQSWHHMHGNTYDLVDCAVFSATYLMYRHLMNGADIRFSLPEMPEAEQIINKLIEIEWYKIKLFGNGYEGRRFWMSEATTSLYSMNWCAKTGERCNKICDYSSCKL